MHAHSADARLASAPRRPTGTLSCVTGRAARRSWTGSSPDMSTLYLAAMDALYQACAQPGAQARGFPG